MKWKAIITGMLISTAVGAEAIIERVDFKANDKGAEVMVSVDLFSLADLFKEKSPVRHMEFRDEGLNFVQTDPDAETIARLLEQYGTQGEESHWAKFSGRYKTAATIAAIGGAIAYIVSESKESSGGRDQNISAGGNVNFNSGQVSGNNGNTQTAEEEVEAEVVEGIE
jgi:hypothetical protein